MKESVEDRLHRLAKRLVELTDRRKIQWEAFDATTFRYERASGTIWISSRDTDGSPPYFLGVENDDGVTLESLRTSPLMSPPEPWDDELEALYETARRQALDIEATLDNILKDLNEL